MMGTLRLPLANLLQNKLDKFANIGAALIKANVKGSTS